MTYADDYSHEAQLWLGENAPVPDDHPLARHYWRRLARGCLANKIKWHCLKCGATSTLQRAEGDSLCKVAEQHFEN